MERGVNLGGKQRIPVYTLIAFCVYVFISGLFKGDIVSTWAIHPSAVLSGEYYRLVSALFIHLDIIHLLFNMYALYLYGGYMADGYGGGAFLKAFFVTGIGSSLGVLWFGGVNVLTAGASGAIFGIVAYLYTQAILKRRIDFDSLFPVVVWVVISNLIPGVSVIGHISGLVVGIVLGAIDYAMGRLRREIRKARWRKHGLPEKRKKGGTGGFVSIFGMGLKGLFVLLVLVLIYNYAPKLFSGELKLEGKRNVLTSSIKDITEKLVSDTPAKTDSTTKPVPKVQTTKEELEEKMEKLPVVVRDFKFVEEHPWEYSDYTELYYEVSFENQGKSDILDIAFILFEWDDKGMPVRPKVASTHYLWEYVSHIKQYEVNVSAGGIGVIRNRCEYDPISGHSYKIIPTGYSTYGGTIWENPYLEDILEVYYGQKYDE
jgi:membrane associated rhomboid family serine protease